MDRPVTGQGVMGMKTQGQGMGRLVEDNSYYVGLIRKKISDVEKETKKLRTEIDQQSRDNSSFASLEKKYETLIKDKEKLEGQLADYNLAMDKTRTSTDPDEVGQQAAMLAEKNKKTGQEVDRVFKARKQKEEDTLKAEEQIEGQYQAIQKRINELEPGKLRAYNDLLAKQRELQERIGHGDHRLNEINDKIRQYETDEKSNTHRKEFAQLERQYRSLRRDADALDEELEIVGLDPKDAHTRYVDRVNNFKQITKSLEEKSESMKKEIREMKSTLVESDASSGVPDEDVQGKYELLQKRDQEMTAFMSKFDDMREGILSEQQAARDIVVALLEHIGRGIDESSQMPSREAHGEMEDAKAFKEKNLATAQRTMEGLQAEKRKRERDLELLRISEPKLQKELASLKETMERMGRDMENFQDIEGMRRRFEQTERQLQELKQSYIKRRDSMRQQVQSASSEHETIKKSLTAHETARELEESERRLKHNERTIFELKEFVESKSRETDYLALKSNCLRVLDMLNGINVRKSQGDGPGTYK